jgi:mono/diheme cytochrome c family protein
MARLFLCLLIAGMAVGRAEAAAVDCAKPVAPCTACHSPMLTRNYANCAATPWTAPAAAKDAHTPLAASPKTVAAGKANFGILCEGCHGPKADGAGPIAIKFSIPVADLTTKQVQAESDGELFWKLTHGYGAMPKWGEVLSDDDRWQLIAYIRSLKK